MIDSMDIRTDMDTVQITETCGYKIASYYRKGELRDIFRLPVKKVRRIKMFDCFGRLKDCDNCRSRFVNGVSCPYMD